MFKYFTFLLFPLFLIASPDLSNLSDFKKIPQDINFYINNINEKTVQQFNSKKLLSQFFLPWMSKKIISKKDILWMKKSFPHKYGFSENLSKYNLKKIKELFHNADLDNFGENNQIKKGITIDYINIRGLPTNKPYVLDPKRAGEGLPFDYLQSSVIYPNTPIQVLHYSKNKQWVFIATKNIYGWVEEKNIAYLSEDKANDLMKFNWGFIYKDNIDIYSNNDNRFLIKSKIGMLLPLSSYKKNLFTTFIATADINQNLVLKTSLISDKFISKNALTFNKENVKTILSQLLGINYGWGGIYNNRDCSSTLQDFFFVFGKYLPRNSFKQSKIGIKFNIKHMDFADKIDNIKKYAKPFQTLIHKKGHIVLYLGTYNDEIIVFHNIWGVKYFNDNNIEKRDIIGGSVISSLFLGNDIKNSNRVETLIKNIDSFNILY